MNWARTKCVKMKGGDTGCWLSPIDVPGLRLAATVFQPGGEVVHYERPPCGYYVWSVRGWHNRQRETFEHVRLEPDGRIRPVSDKDYRADGHLKGTGKPKSQEMFLVKSDGKPKKAKAKAKKGRKGGQPRKKRLVL